MITLLIALLALFTPLDCLGDVDSAVWIDNQLHGHAIDEWQPVGELTGRDIWVGYDAGGFDVPDNVERYGLIVGVVDGEQVRVWVWGSDNTSELYLFPFINLEPFTDDNGEHYGIHPCAAGAVDKVAFLQAVGSEE